MSKPNTKTTKAPVIEKTTSTTEISSKDDVSSELFGENGPIVKSIGYAKVPGSNYCVSYIIHSQGGKIIKIEVEEPNMQSIAEETAKLNFVNIFMSYHE